MLAKRAEEKNEPRIGRATMTPLKWIDLQSDGHREHQSARTGIRSRGAFMIPLEKPRFGYNVLYEGCFRRFRWRIVIPGMTFVLGRCLKPDAK